MAEHLVTTVADHIATVTLNRADTRNPISDTPMVDALVETMTALDHDDDVHVIILTGAGTSFSTGGNVRHMEPGHGLAAHEPVRTRRNYRAGIQRIPLMMESLETPVIAAVNGPAMGAGCDLACMCDIRIAAKSARFAESFVKLGIIPGDGGAWLLPKIVGFSKACEMALTGDAVSASEALECGLVSRVVDDEQLMEEALALASRISANSPHAVRMTKRLLKAGRSGDLASSLDLAGAMQALAHTTDDHREALATILDKLGRK